MDKHSLSQKCEILVATDIFGRNESVDCFLKDVGIKNRVLTVSPYTTDYRIFANEQQAYQAFNQVGGIEAYILKLEKVVTTLPNLVYMIGFSAGAAALYKVMSLARQNKPVLFMFYPGQIRHFLHPSPKVECEIVFPAFEEHFDLNHVLHSLQSLEQLNIRQSASQHGFMNSLSTGFDPDEYQYYCQKLAADIAKRQTVSKT